MTKTSGQSIAPDVSDEVRRILDEAAKKQRDNELSRTPFLSIKNKKFAIGELKLGTTLNVVVLANVFDNAYYDRPYDPDVMMPPACFAIGEVQSELVPNDTSPDVQSPACDGCPKNEFGSSGKGKVCRNGRRLLMAVVVDNKLDMDNLVILNLAPTSLKAFSQYSKRLSNLTKLPLWACITNLSFDDDVAWPQIVPTFVNPLDADNISSIATKINDYTIEVSIPYDTSGYEPLGSTPASGTKRSKMS